MTKIFISCATKELGGYRTRLGAELKESLDIDVVIQEYLIQSRYDTLKKLADSMRSCTAMVHIIGQSPGSLAHAEAEEELREFQSTADQLGDLSRLTYTHWEPFIAYHFKRIPIFVFVATRPITDGHPKGKPPFRAQVSDEAIIREHRDRLDAIYRYQEEFSDYTSLKQAVSRTLYNDLDNRVATAEELLSKQQAEETDAKNRGERRQRFGKNAVNELRAVVARNPQVFSPSFVSATCLRLHKSISWTFPEDWRSPSDDQRMNVFLIDWIAEHFDADLFPALVWVLGRRAKACGCNEAEQDLVRILQDVVAARGLTPLGVEGMAPDAEEVERDSKQGVLQVTYTVSRHGDAATTVRKAAMRIGSYVSPGHLDEGTCGELIQDARVRFSSSEFKVFPLNRVEVFCAEADLEFHWERRTPAKLHPLPVVVRLNRNRVDHDDLPDPPDVLSRTRIPCRFTDPDNFEMDIEQHGVFVAGWLADQSRDETLLARAAGSATVGIWVREPIEATAAEEILDELNDMEIAVLPAHAHEQRKKRSGCWENVAVLYDPKGTSFPSRSNQQRNLNRLL